jgi:hypothetical protein
VELRHQGQPVTEIAPKFHLSQVTIYKILAEAA